MNKCLLYIKLKTFAKKYTKANNFPFDILAFVGVFSVALHFHLIFKQAIQNNKNNFYISLYSCSPQRHYSYSTNRGFPVSFFSLVCSFSFFLLCLNFRGSLFFFCSYNRFKHLKYVVLLLQEKSGKNEENFSQKKTLELFFL